MTPKTEAFISGEGARIESTRRHYEDRLAQVLDLARAPMTIAEFALELFGETAGYHRLLALEEAGAYVEYLSMRGHLRVRDLESLERGDGSTIYYQSADPTFQRLQPTALTDAKLGELDVRI